MELVLVIVGTLVVLAVMLDIFFTVLFPASRRRILGRPISEAVWLVFRLLAWATRGGARRRLLSYSGPSVVAITVTAWLVLLVIGWAMIYKPALGTAVIVTRDPGDTGWVTALYYSGYNLSTLGIGDVEPLTDAYRLLTITQAGLGFSVFSLSVAYFLSVSTSLTDRNTFAQALHQRTGGTGDAAELIARLAYDADLPDARQQLASSAEFLRRIHQAHRGYPILRYFSYRESFYGLPRILLTVLDTAALLRTALHEARYRHLTRSSAADELFESALTLMHELVPRATAEAPSADLELRWRARYRAAVERLEAAGLRIRENADAGADDYVAIRAAWDGPLRQLAEAMLYEWEDDGGLAVESRPREPRASG